MTPPGLFDAPARQAASLAETAHRPWPVPARPWRMGQTWENLLFAHWRVPVESVRALVPDGLDVETFDGSAWLGITPFRISALRLRGLPPAPHVSTFLELNVRTYVSQREAGSRAKPATPRSGSSRAAAERPGIWFFSLDAASRLAVEAARRAYRLPYHLASMRADRQGDWIRYESARRYSRARPHVFSARYRPSGRAGPPRPGSLEHFLTERYCLYTVHGERIHRADIHHRPWPLQEAEARIELNTMAPDPLELAGDPSLLHFSGRQDVVIWPLEAV